MAHTEQFQRSTYPVMAYNFRVVISDTTLSFAEVSGLSRGYDHVTYRHGLSYLEGERITKHRLVKYAPITLKRGTVPGITTLSDWLEKKQPVPMDVILYDAAGDPVVKWHVAKALAVKLSAPTFDASTNEVSIETLEVMAAGISIQDLTEQE